MLGRHKILSKFFVPTAFGTTSLSEQYWCWEFRDRRDIYYIGDIVPGFPEEIIRNETHVPAGW